MRRLSSLERSWRVTPKQTETPSAEGFIKKNGASALDLRLRDTGDGPPFVSGYDTPEIGAQLRLQPRDCVGERSQLAHGRTSADARLDHRRERKDRPLRPPSCGSETS